MQYTEYRNRVINSDLSFLLLVKFPLLWKILFYFLLYKCYEQQNFWKKGILVLLQANRKYFCIYYIRRMSKCHCCFYHLLPVMKITKCVELWKSEELNLEWDTYEILSSSSNSHRKEYYKGIAARRFIFCWEAQNTK